MIDWNLAWKIAGGGFGVTILILMILSLVAWVMGLVAQKTITKGKEDSGKAGKG